MIALLLKMIAVLFGYFAALTIAVSGLVGLMADCEWEDSSDCYWNGSERGNGQGRSFVDIGGLTIYLD